MATEDYGLSSADLETHRRAVQNAQPTTTLGDALGSIGTGVQEKVEELKEKKEEEKEEQERLDEEAGIQELNWDTAFDAMGDRGSWASPEMYDNFYKMEQEYKSQYIEAVRGGDKVGAAKMMAAQQKRSTALKSWVTTMDEAASVDGGVGWGAVMDRKPEDKALLEVLAKNDGRASMKVGENGEMTFDVEVPDGKGGTTIRTVTQREVEKMVVKGTAPTELKKALLDRNQQLVVSGQKDEPFNDEDTKAINRGALTNDQIPSFFAEEFGGMNFKEHIKSHPDFKAAYAEGDYMAGVDPTPEDGVLTSEDMANFSDNEMNLILDEMEKNPDVAKDYIADWMTKIQKQNWQKGRDNQVAKDKKTTRDAINATVSKAAALNNLAENRKIEKREKLEELRKTDIIVDGAVDQYNNPLNLGKIGNFKWSSVDEVWQIKDSSGNWKPIDTALAVLVDDPSKIDEINAQLNARRVVKLGDD